MNNTAEKKEKSEALEKSTKELKNNLYSLVLMGMTMPDSGVNKFPGVDWSTSGRPEKAFYPLTSIISSAVLNDDVMFNLLNLLRDSNCPIARNLRLAIANAYASEEAPKWARLEAS